MWLQLMVIIGDPTVRGGMPFHEASVKASRTHHIHDVDDNPGSRWHLFQVDTSDKVLIVVDLSEACLFCVRSPLLPNVTGRNVKGQTCLGVLS